MEVEAAAATHVQAHARGMVTRMATDRARREGFEDRRREQQESAAIRVQARARGNAARKDAEAKRVQQAALDGAVDERKAAATTMQARARGHISHKTAEREKFEVERDEQLTAAATRVQARARGMAARKQQDVQRAQQAALEGAATTVQAHARGMLARDTTSAEHRGGRGGDEEREAELEKAATKVQARARGMFARRQVNEKASEVEMARAQQAAAVRAAEAEEREMQQMQHQAEETEKLERRNDFRDLTKAQNELAKVRKELKGIQRNLNAELGVLKKQRDEQAAAAAAEGAALRACAAGAGEMAAALTTLWEGVSHAWALHENALVEGEGFDHAECTRIELRAMQEAAREASIELVETRARISKAADEQTRREAREHDEAVRALEEEVARKCELAVSRAVGVATADVRAAAVVERREAVRSAALLTCMKQEEVAEEAQRDEVARAQAAAEAAVLQAAVTRANAIDEAEAALRAKLQREHHEEMLAVRVAARREVQSARLSARREARAEMIGVAITAARAAADALVNADGGIVSEVAAAAAVSSRQVVLFEKWPPHMAAQERRNAAIRDATQVETGEINGIDEALAALRREADVEAARSADLLYLLECRSDELEAAREELVTLRAQEERYQEGRLPRRMRRRAAAWMGRLHVPVLPRRQRRCEKGDGVADAAPEADDGVLPDKGPGYVGHTSEYMISASAQ